MTASDCCLGAGTADAEHAIVACNPEGCSSKASTKFVVENELFLYSFRGLKL